MEHREILLGVNIDHAATLRQARYRGAPRTCGGMVEPDPVALSQLAERAGADQITVHLREDRRHIQEEDVRRLRDCLSVRLNLEMACEESITRFALELLPAAACLVPESREEITTEGGLDVAGQRSRVGGIVDRLGAAGIQVSLFIDPDPEQIAAAAELGAPAVELHTGAYANAYYTPQRGAELERLRSGARAAAERGLLVHAGHGINYVNIAEVRLLPSLRELNIGHSILSRALFSGLGEAVSEMKRRLSQG
jgi:pyridoxine 5-phosphate synthase